MMDVAEKQREQLVKMAAGEDETAGAPAVQQVDFDVAPRSHYLSLFASLPTTAGMHS